MHVVASARDSMLVAPCAIVFLHGMFVLGTGPCGLHLCTSAHAYLRAHLFICRNSRINAREYAYFCMAPSASAIDPIEMMQGRNVCQNVCSSWNY